MGSTAYLLRSFITLAMCLQVASIPTVIGMYGETIEVPCNNGSPAPPNLFFTKWKYENLVGSPGELLIKHAHKDEVTMQAGVGDGYLNRISIAANYSLLISQGTLSDQRTFTCMVVSDEPNLQEYSVNVLVYKKPSPPQITDKAKQLESGKLTMLGTCGVKDANPAAQITWSKNGQPLVNDGKNVIITSRQTKDPVTGLLSTSSSLQYVSRKSDKGARFSCTSMHELGQQESDMETFVIHYPTENVVLDVSPKHPISEGDNVTLKCDADGNPRPSAFHFHLKGQKVTVRGSDTYNLTAVTRKNAGEYKCSLLDSEKIESSTTIAVNYLDFSLSPSGTILKRVGDMLDVKIEKNASGEAKVTWMKDGKIDKEPVFHKLKYSDAGMYKCEMVVAGIHRRQSFTLVVEGHPVIKKLTKQHSEDGTHNLVCEAEGAPQPTVQWSVNGTDEQIFYDCGKATYKITVVPTNNQTVTCVVTNKLGEDVMAINISSLFKEEIHEKGSQDEGNDQSILIVGIVVGLIVAAALVGLIYWIYMKKSRQGSWKTGEKETGTSEESKKLGETNHKGDVV